MDEHVTAAVVLGDESEALLAVEPFDVDRDALAAMTWHRGATRTRALMVLGAAAADYRSIGFPDPPWDLIGIFTQGCLLPAPREG